MGFFLPYGTSEWRPHGVACYSVRLLCCCVWYILNCNVKAPSPTSQPIMQDANPGRDWWIASWPYFYHNFTEQNKYNNVLSCNWWCCFNTGKVFNWLCRDIVWKLRGQYLYGNVRGMCSHLGCCRMASGHLCCVRHEAKTRTQINLCLSSCAATCSTNILSHSLWRWWWRDLSVMSDSTGSPHCQVCWTSDAWYKKQWLSSVFLCLLCLIWEPIDFLCVVSFKHGRCI